MDVFILVYTVMLVFNHSVKEHTVLSKINKDVNQKRSRKFLDFLKYFNTVFRLELLISEYDSLLMS